MKVFAAALIAIGLLAAGTVRAEGYEFKGFRIGETKEVFLAKHPWQCRQLEVPPSRYDEVCTPESVADKTYMGNLADMRARVLEGHVVSIEIDLWSGYYGETLSALAERYGAPNKTSQIDVSRRFASWSNASGERIMLLERLLGSTGSLVFRSTRGAEELKRRDAAIDKAKKQDM